MTIDQYHIILDYIRRLIEGTQWENHVYAVGGCCRDEILGNDIKDIDLAVDLAGGGIGFAQWIYEKGLAVKEPVTFPSFGTAMLRFSEFPDEEIEIVQTRAEKYTDSTRRDPTVVFGPIEQDCYRRDLTINALYYDISRRRLLDILGTSVDDIHNHIIRTPADPDTTFDDDPVRILRAVRLAARYGWEIEPETFRGMANNAERLRIVRPERMQAEFDKMLTGPAPAAAMELLRRCGAMHYVIPELEGLYGLQQTACHNGDAWDFTLRTLDKVRPDTVLRLAALLQDVAKPLCKTSGKNGAPRFPGHDRRCKGLIHTAMRRLHYDKRIIDKVIFLASNHMAASAWGDRAERMTDVNLRRLQNRCANRARFDALMELIEADNMSYTPTRPQQVASIRQRSDELERQGLSLFSFKRQINVNKLKKLKRLPKGADIKPYVAFLLEMAIENPRMSPELVRQRLKNFTPKGGK